MRERTLYIVIGVLIGVVIMQWRQGPQPAQAQVPEVITGYRVASYERNSYHFVMLSNGDVYKRELTMQDPVFGSPLRYLGNYWDGAPVPTSNESWGSIKAKSK